MPSPNLKRCVALHIPTLWHRHESRAQALEYDAGQAKQATSDVITLL
jgi:hypothetical protein